MSDSKEIAFTPKPEDVKLRVTRSFKRKEVAKKFCNHLHIEVDDFNRTINCSDCGAHLDPFEYLLSWAQQEQMYELNITQVKRQLTELTKERDELAKSVGYLRRKTKSENNKNRKLTV